LRGERKLWDTEPAAEHDFADDEEDGGQFVEEGATELDQISGDISEVIDCLFRLSVSIRNPACREALPMGTEIEAQVHVYIEDVRKAFREADEEMIGRLGRANAHRRQYFSSQEQRRKNLVRGIAEAQDGGSAGKVKQEPDAIGEDKPSSGQTKTTAPSVASSLVARHRPRIPPLPKDATSRPFECPYCYRMVFATTTRAWRLIVPT
jgi:hypothetical protein